jgi:hypothetical protein
MDMLCDEFYETNEIIKAIREAENKTIGRVELCEATGGAVLWET